MALVYNIPRMYMLSSVRDIHLMSKRALSKRYASHSLFVVILDAMHRELSYVHFVHSKGVLHNVRRNAITVFSYTMHTRVLISP